MRDSLLGIDIGNTMIKAVLFDLQGGILNAAECAGETHQPQAGFAERSIEEIYSGVTQAIRQCLDHPQAGEWRMADNRDRGRRAWQRLVRAGQRKTAFTRNTVNRQPRH